MVGLICLILTSFLSLFRVKAESRSTINIIDSWTTQTDSQQIDTANEESQSDDISDGTVGSTGNNDVDDSQTSEDNQGEIKDEKKNSDNNSLFSVILGGVMALAGSIITSLLNSREASKQRQFQLTSAEKDRNDENKKELNLYRRKVYTDYIQSLRNLNTFISSNPNCSIEDFNKYQKQVIECDACVTLIGSESVMSIANDITASVRFNMQPIKNSKISDLIKTMRDDINIVVQHSCGNTSDQPK